MKLNGKVALITGAASGIGYAIAKRYLEADGRVIIADLSSEAARHAANALADTRSAIGVGSSGGSAHRRTGTPSASSASTACGPRSMRA